MIRRLTRQTLIGILAVSVSAILLQSGLTQRSVISIGDLWGIVSIVWGLYTILIDRRVGISAPDNPRPYFHLTGAWAVMAGLLFIALGIYSIAKF